MTGLKPFWEQALMGIALPPVTASIFFLAIRGWAFVIQAGKISDTTRNRQKQLSLGMLFGMYVVLASTFIYEYFVVR